MRDAINSLTALDRAGVDPRSLHSRRFSLRAGANASERPSMMAQDGSPTRSRGRSCVDPFAMRIRSDAAHFPQPALGA